MLRANVLHVSETEQVWSDFHDAVTRFVRARVPDDATADDIVQDVFVRIHERRAQLDDSERLAGWVFRIAKNAVIDHYRKARPSSPDGPVEDDEVGDVDDTREAIATWVAAQVHELDPKYREAIELVELQGLSQVEAAEQLGLSVSGMKSRVQRGRAQLREKLEKCCEVSVDSRGRLYEVAPKNCC